VAFGLALRAILLYAGPSAPAQAWSSRTKSRYLAISSRQDLTADARGRRGLAAELKPRYGPYSGMPNGAAGR
jgi:hypothetical protein